MWVLRVFMGFLVDFVGFFLSNLVGDVVSTSSSSQVHIGLAGGSGCNAGGGIREGPGLQVENDVRVADDQL